MLVIIIVISLVFSINNDFHFEKNKEGMGWGVFDWIRREREERERREREQRERREREDRERQAALEKARKEAAEKAGSEAAARAAAANQLQIINKNTEFAKQVNAINNQGTNENIQYGQQLISRQSNLRKDGIEVKPGSSNILTFFIDYSGIKGGDWTQILGITADRNGGDQRYLAIWLYPGSSAFHIRTATSNGSNDTAIGPKDGNYLLTPGTHRIDIISNTIVESNNIYQLFSLYDNKNPIIENYKTGAQRDKNNRIITDYNFPLYIYSSYGYRHQSELGANVYNVVFTSGKGPFNLNDADDALTNYKKILNQVTR